MALDTGRFLEPGHLADAIFRLPASIYKSVERPSPTLRSSTEQIPAVGEVKQGGLADHDGRIVVRRGEVFEALVVPGSVVARIRGMLQVRDAVRQVFQTQLSDASDEAIVVVQLQLLDEDEQTEILEALGEAEPAKFLEQARSFNASAFCESPLSLSLLYKTVS